MEELAQNRTYADSPIKAYLWGCIALAPLPGIELVRKP